MSALTDLFTAFANKIRSKTGGSDTYTPPEMVDAIDDVYDAGEAAGVAATKVGNAAAGDVLSGKTFTNSTTVGESGSMANNGAVSATLNTSTTSYTVPAGYHNGSGTVSITTQSKSATPSTSAQTISPDAGKVLSSVSVGAIQIDSTNNSATPTTSAQTVNPASGKYFNTFSVGAIPSEYIIPSGNKAITANGTGIDVKNYATASVSVSGTSITPSNSSPASMTSGTLYTPSANGYAISSYSSTTPSNSSPVSLSSGSIHKMGGAGYAISSYSNVTPSDSSPVTLSSGSIYKMSGAGKAVASVTNITPSDSSPVAMTSGTVYKADGAGYAIKNSPTSLTPSDTSPPSIASGTIYKGGGTGSAISSYTNMTPSASWQSVSAGFYKMGGTGYVIQTQPSAGYTYGWNSETAVWTNGSPSSALSSSTVTVSNISTYTYLKFEYKIWADTSDTNYIIVSRSQFQNATDANGKFKFGVGCRTSSGTNYFRAIFYVSNTQIKFDTGRQTGSSSTATSACIITKIYGLK